MTGQQVLDFEIEQLERQRQAEQRVADLNRLGGFSWSCNRLVGFTSAEGAAEFERLWPGYRTYLVTEEKRQ